MAEGEESPAAEGFRWPAEWEPHAATWLSWPHNRETWPGDGSLERTESAFVAMVAALVDHERVCINVADDRTAGVVRTELRRAGVDPERGVEIHRIPTDDAWVRDHGAIFLVHSDTGEHAALDFGFDAWGGKYPPWDRDDAVAKQMAAVRGLRRFEPGFVLEGGSIDGDGAGTLLTTESCLLNPNRGPVRTRELMEARLANNLGARHVIWLGDGIAGDDTDGHVDDFARFIAPGRVVVAVEDDRSDANHAPLENARAVLAAAHDADGKKLEAVELPMPRPRTLDGARLPASYANFYLANGVVLMPAFDEPNDARAAAILTEACEGRTIVPIPCSELVIGLGGVHCLTQQEPQ